MSDPRSKDPAILDTLKRLRSTFGDGAFVVVDHWDSDLNAVGIAKPDNRRVLVYFAAYGNGYYAELELPSPAGDDMPYRVVGRCSGLTFDQLARVVACHLALPDPD